MAQQIQLRNDSAAAWEAENPILAQAEVGVNTTTGQFKIGDGTSTWEELEYYAGGSANTADFVFLDDGGDGSYMTVTDHDMTIQTVRDEDSVGSDCDINIEAADDVFIRAYGDDIGIYASSEVFIQTNNYDGQGTGNSGTGPSHEWVFTSDGHIQFPDGTIQTTSAQGIRPLPSFLTWREGQTHLPDLNTHFGWNSEGLWFQNANGGSGTSYPVFTNFTIPESSSVVAEFIVNINDECSDVGICIYSDEANPEWSWNTNLTRIAAQFDCTSLQLVGRTTSAGGEVNVPDPGIYRVRFAYDPAAPTDKVTVSYQVQGSDQVLETLTINEALPAGPYRVGFAADQNSSTVKTYMTYVSINVNDGDDIYGEDLDNGNSGITSEVDLVVPTAIKDGDGDDFITFTRTSTGTARIGTPQDDLSLRSARDITLIAGDDGPGNVYIGWGDATITPNATNRVATIGDVQSLTSGDFEFNNSTMSTEDVTMKIEAKRNSSTLGAAIELDPYDGQVTLFGYSGNRTSSYSTNDWADAMWSAWGEGGSQVLISDAAELVTFLNETFNPAPFRSVSINGSDYYEFDGFGGNSDEVTLYMLAGAPNFPTTVTSLEFRYQTVSRIEVDEDDSRILIDGVDLNVDIRSTDDVEITGNQVVLQSNNNIRFVSDLGDSDHEWRMASDGTLEFPANGKIRNPRQSSGDGNGYDTFEIIPDSSRYETDQYLIIDPTFGSPSHIHIRAGGQQDNSNADVILGAERTHVRVSDTAGAVYVSSKREDTTNTYENGGGFEPTVLAIVGDLSYIQPYSNFSVDVDGTLYQIDGVSYNSGTNVTQITASPATFIMGNSYTIHEANGENYWSFTENGYLYGPAMGGLLVTAVSNNDGDLYVQSNEDVRINSGENHDIYLSPGMSGKIFLEPAADHVYIGPENPENRVVQFGELAYIRVAVPTSSIGVEGHVEGMVADDGNFHYYCTGDYDGTNHIWKRVGWTAGTWGV
jgi:hypothetical protein